MLRTFTEQELKYINHEPIYLALEGEYDIGFLQEGFYSSLDSDFLGELYVTEYPFHDNILPANSVSHSEWLASVRLSAADYGVCDTPEQILETYPEIVDDPRSFAIELRPVFAKDQYPEGGWRWHKHGAYIGDQNPQCEYLYDEEGIEKVYVFSVVQVKTPDDPTYPDVSVMRELDDEQKEMLERIRKESA